MGENRLVHLCLGVDLLGLARSRYGRIVVLLLLDLCGLVGEQVLDEVLLVEVLLETYLRLRVGHNGGWIVRVVLLDQLLLRAPGYKSLLPERLSIEVGRLVDAHHVGAVLAFDPSVGPKARFF